MTTNYFFTKNDGLSPFVTLAKAKKQLRLEADFAEEDDLITDYIEAATVAAEDYLNKRLFEGMLTFECSSFTNPFVFTQSDDSDTVASVEYYAKDGDGETLNAVEDTDFKLRKSSTIGCKEIKFTATLPETEVRDDAVIIKINQGFAVADLPKPIYQAIMLMVTSMYEKREDIGEIGFNQASRNLLRPYRNF
jgi:uncharacterized phiE125 gp8 family phage protein